MSILTETWPDASNPLKELELALQQELTGGRSKVEIDFKEAYPLFEQGIAQKLRKRKLMDRFNAAYKHELNLAQFRKLLNAERDRRNASGDTVTCAACSQPLVAAAGAETLEDA
ncbi:hypothetical protein [Luteimonas sp. A649]